MSGGSALDIDAPVDDFVTAAPPPSSAGRRAERAALREFVRRRIRSPNAVEQDVLLEASAPLESVLEVSVAAVPPFASWCRVVYISIPESTCPSSE